MTPTEANRRTRELGREIDDLAPRVRTGDPEALARVSEINRELAEVMRAVATGSAEGDGW